MQVQKISFSNQSKSNQTFTSIIPTRVFIDGKESLNEKNIKAACNKFISLATKKYKTGSHDSLMVNLASRDPDLNLYDIFDAMVKSYKKLPASNFIRLIFENNKTYIATGKQAEKLLELGKAVGANKNVCKDYGRTDSFELSSAQRAYGDYIKSIINNNKIALTEGYNTQKQRIGRPLSLNILMKSNGRYGHSDFKMDVS